MSTFEEQVDSGEETPVNGEEAKGGEGVLTLQQVADLKVEESRLSTKEIAELKGVSKEIVLAAINNESLPSKPVQVWSERKGKVVPLHLVLESDAESWTPDAATDDSEAAAEPEPVGQVVEAEQAEEKPKRARKPKEGSAFLQGAMTDVRSAANPGKKPAKQPKAEKPAKVAKPKAEKPAKVAKPKAEKVAKPKAAKVAKPKAEKPQAEKFAKPKPVRIEINKDGGVVIKGKVGWLSAAEVAQHHDVSREAVRQAMEKHRLPHEVIKIGGFEMYMIYFADAQAWMPRKYKSEAEKAALAKSEAAEKKIKAAAKAPAKVKKAKRSTKK